jgi:radical SAM superfamily enzyme YgiQ (UPF0313 family)
MNSRPCQKILLLQPPVRDFYETDIRLQPLGLCYLKACCEKKLPGTVVTVRDYHSGYRKKTLALPGKLTYLKKYYIADKSPFSTFSQYFHFGADFPEILADVQSLKPDLIGISALFSAYAEEALELAALLKKACNVPVLFGGSHVSARPESILNRPFVDFVITGEGEKPFVELIKSLQNGDSPEKIPNLGYKKNGRIFLNPRQKNYSLDEIPEPDFSDLPPENYLYCKKSLSFILSTRGCPYKCRFCSVHNTFTEGFRCREITQIIAEMKNRYADGIRVFDFEDDNINYDKERYKALLCAIIENFPEADIQLMAMNGMAWHRLEPEILLLMKRAGFSHLNIALVSSNQDINRKMQRPWPLEDFELLTEQACEHSFLTTAYCIFGLPGDRLENMLDSLIFLARLPVLIGVSPFYLPPGCPLETELSTKGDENTDYSVLARMTALNIFNGNFDRDDIFTLFILARIINFLKDFNGKDETPLAEVLNVLSKLNKRAAEGVEIIKRLQTGQAHHPCFKTRLFTSFFAKAAYITGLSGQKILL